MKDKHKDKFNSINGRIKAFITKRWTILVLLLIVAIGAYLRFDGATWGYPLRLHPDEKVIVDSAIFMSNNHSYEVTRDYNHPDHTPIKMQVVLFWSLRHIEQAVSISKMQDSEVMEVISQFDESQFDKKLHIIQEQPLKVQLFLLNCMSNHQIPFGRANDHFLYVGAGRALSALFGVICIVFAYLIGKQIHKNVGLLCALLFALFANFVEHSHYITPEIYQTAFTLAMVYFSIIYYRSPKRKFLFCACVCAAFAFCTKYPALFSFPVIIAAVIFANPKSETESTFKAALKKIHNCVIAIAMFGVSVFVFSPVLLFDISSVYVGVMVEARATHLGADGLGYLGNLFFYLNCYSKHSGIIISVFSILGFWHCWKENKQIFILLLLGILYAPIIAMLSLHWDRWGVPFYAFALVFAAVGIYKTFIWVKLIFHDFITRHTPTPKIKLVLSFMAVLFFAISLANLSINSMAMVMRFAVTTDTRNASIEYLSEIGATVENTLYEGYTPFRPASPKNIFAQFESMDISKPIDPGIEFIVLSSAMYSRYYAEPDKYGRYIEFYDALKADKTVIREFVPVADWTIANNLESANDIINIVNSIKIIYGFINGGYTGPNLIFYQF